MHVNTLLLQGVLAEPKWAEKLTDADDVPYPRCSGPTSILTAASSWT
ncbi:hypothetical protein [Streptomyces sp. NPDC048248]